MRSFYYCRGARLLTGCARLCLSRQVRRVKDSWKVSLRDGTGPMLVPRANVLLTDYAFTKCEAELTL